MDLLEQHGAIVTALSAVPLAYRDVPDDALLALGRRVADAQRLVSTHAALIAGEVARRSDPALGSSGLAQRTGHRTPEELVRVTTGSTRRDARTAVSVGSLAASPSEWLTPVASALTAGTISVDAAAAIRTGLGVPTTEITAAVLRDAAVGLCEVAPSLDADRLLRLARDARDALDEEGIRDREAARYAARSLKFWRTGDGGAQLHWVMDPETAATVGELFDRITSPRRGGPRFVNPADTALADAVTADTRSTEQLASDTFAHLLAAGADADSTQLLGSGGPVVRILVAEKDLVAEKGPSTSDVTTGTRIADTPATGTLTAGSRPTGASRTGHARIEGTPTPISLESAERATCTGSTIPVLFDSAGQVLDLGREQRLYTRRQRAALAARDGGCMWPGCDRPPSWTEAHHIHHWERDHGNTDIADGILLCKFHHLLLHNNHWEIIRTGATYQLIPPQKEDPNQTPILLHSKSAALTELLAST